MSRTLWGYGFIRFALLLFCSAPGMAASTDATPFIPGVNALVLDPTALGTLYAGTDDGVFKSVGSGESWRRASEGLPNFAVLSLAIDPLMPNVLYAGNRNPAAVYRSSDGAASWTVSSTGLPPAGVAEIAVDPQNPSRIFAVTQRGLFRSLDGAQTWSRVDQMSGNWFEVVIDPRNFQTLYAVITTIPFIGPLVFKSENGGETWTPSSAGFPVGPRGPVVGDQLAIDPLTPTTLYASSIGVYKTLDGAGRWFAVNEGLPCSPPLCPVVSSLAVDPMFPARVYAGTLLFGFFRSTNGGGLWISGNTGLGARVVKTLMFDPRRPDTIYAGTDRGVFRSDDAGATWRQASEGLAHPDRLRLLQGRFFVELRATDPRTGWVANGRPIAVNDLFGYFSLPELTGTLENPEVFVKMLNGISINQRYWVFYGGLTDLEYTLTVTDSLTGQTVSYQKEFGSACGGSDTEAFPR